MQTISKKQRIEYFDLLRILATLAVITIHVTGPYWYNTEITSVQWQILSIFESISRWSVPIFFMISGTLFLDGNRDIRQILRKNILHVVTAFLFWSAIYSGINYAKGFFTIPDAIQEWLYGYYHMWYLYVIAGLYLAVPILQKITQSRETTKYFLLMSFLFACFFPQLSIWMGFFSPWFQDTANHMLSLLSFDLVCGYCLYFVLGWYLHSTNLSEKARKIIYTLGIVSLLATVLLTSATSLWQKTPIHSFLEYLTPNTFFVSVSVFVFAKYHFSYGKLSPKLITVLQKLSLYSFGVYLVHPLLYDILRYNLGFDLMLWSPLFSVPAATLIITIASFLISALIHQIPVLKKYIV